MSKELIEDEMNTPKITGSPETIWLNYGDLERDDTHENCSRNGDVTWCEEAVFVSDVKYVKADCIEELERDYQQYQREKIEWRKERDQLHEHVKMLREGMVAINTTGVMREAKWAGMSARYIARFTLAATEPKE